MCIVFLNTIGVIYGYRSLLVNDINTYLLEILKFNYVFKFKKTLYSVVSV